MDWLSPVSGLVGAVFGAVASYAGTHHAQKRELAAIRQARLDAKQDAAVAVLADTLGKLLTHVRDVPDLLPHVVNDPESAALAATAQAWDRDLNDLTGPARLAIGVIRHGALRGRLKETMTLLEHWRHGLEYAYGDAGSRSWVLHGVITHAVACMEVWQLERPELPEPDGAFAAARSSLQQKREEWEYTEEANRETQQEHRRQLRERAAALHRPQAGENLPPTAQ